MFYFHLICFNFRFDKMSEEKKEKSLTDQVEDNGKQQIFQVYTFNFIIIPSQRKIKHG